MNETNTDNGAEHDAENESTNMTNNTPAEDAGRQTVPQTTPRQATISKRPWGLSAIEFKIPSENNTTKSVWATSVVDANGNLVCYGDSENMKLIVELENSVNGILGDLKAIGHFVERSKEQIGKLSR